MIARRCLGCSRGTTAGSRCPECRAQLQATQANRVVYDNPRWRRLRSALIGRHIAKHGMVCFGPSGLDPHSADVLTADHVVPLAAGGAPFDLDNIGVLCRSCNAQKGARLAGGTPWS